MIAKGATLTIQRIPLAQLQAAEDGYFLEKVILYLELLRANPDQDVDPLVVRPSVAQPDLYLIQNGKHRYWASIIAGRPDVLCIVEEDPK